MVQFVFSGPVPSATELPRISGTELEGQTLSLSTAGLTGISARQWIEDGVDIGGQTGTTLDTTGRGGAFISCRIVCDQGTLTTPEVRIHDDALASMSAYTAGLLPHSECSHIAFVSGNWDSPSTWHTGTVPAAGDNVLIQRGVEVVYNIGSAVRLDRLRVDGRLKVSRVTSTQMLVETLVVNVGGWLDLGTSFADKISANSSCTITISNRCYIDNPAAPTFLNLTRDPNLMGRGILVTGKITAFGAAKTPWVKTASHPLIGNSSVTLASAPSNWQVGDTIVIPGTLTTKTGNTIVLQDEQRTISGIAGNVISFSGGLSNNHDIHNASITRNDLQPPIVNITKNITIKSEETAGFGQSAVFRRGHCMFMHENCEVDLWDTKFLNLGRTDKSVNTGVVDGANFRYVDRAVPDIKTTALTATANIQSRYPCHFHFTGFDVNGHNGSTRIVRVVDSFVDETPGWAFAHHGCRVDMIRNSMRSYFGAGMVSETADEQGAWVENVAWGSTCTNTIDNNLKFQEDPTGGMFGDFFKGGIAFASRGRAMRTNRNIAMGSGVGYGFYHRWNVAANNIAPVIYHKTGDLDLKDIVSFQTDFSQTGIMSPVDYPIIHFADNESAGCLLGLSVVKADPEQNHGVNVILKRFKAWAAVRGAVTDYIGQYLLEDFDLVGRGTGAQQGFTLSGSIASVAITRGSANEFGVGVEFQANDVLVNIDEFNDTNKPLFMLNAVNWINCGQNIVYNDNPSNNTIKGALETTRIITSEPAYSPPTHSIPFIMFDSAGVDTGTNLQNGTITDEVGTVTIPNGTEDYNMRPSQFFSMPYINAQGYFTYLGSNIVLVPIHVSSRLTGRPSKVMRAFRYTGSTAGKTNNGAFTLSTTAPVRADISTSCAINGSVNIDVLTAATVESGATKTLDSSFIAPQNGTMRPNGNGVSVDYEPDFGWSGTDLFFVFVYDGRGQYATVQVTVTVS